MYYWDQSITIILVLKDFDCLLLITCYYFEIWSITYYFSITYYLLLWNAVLAEKHYLSLKTIHLSLKTIHLSLKTIHLSLKTIELSLKTNELSLKTNRCICL